MTGNRLLQRHHSTYSVILCLTRHPVWCWMHHTISSSLHTLQQSSTTETPPPRELNTSVCDVCTLTFSLERSNLQAFVKTTYYIYNLLLMKTRDAHHMSKNHVQFWQWLYELIVDLANHCTWADEVHTCVCVCVCVWAPSPVWLPLSGERTNLSSTGFP